MSTSASWTALGTSASVVVRPAPRSASRALRGRGAARSDRRGVQPLSRRLRTDRAECGAPAAHDSRRALLLDAIEVALRAAALTDGEVDPTIGGALIVAGYDRDFGAIGAPAPPRHGRAGRRLVGGRPRPPSRHRPRSRRRVLDLGATAKALAADRAAAAASRAAGQRRARESRRRSRHRRPAAAGGWPVRVADDHRAHDRDAVADDPRSPAAAWPPRAPPSGAGPGPATAHHIIDPRTGRRRPCLADGQRRRRDVRRREHRQPPPRSSAAPGAALAPACAASRRACTTAGGTFTARRLAGR